MRHKTFAVSITLFAFTLPLIAFILHFVPYVNTENDFILNYQLQKLERTKQEPVRTVIVGDSSAGNAVDATRFTALSGEPTLNLALTAGYGITGSLNMLKRAAALHPELRRVLIIQSPDMWHRPLDLSGYFKTRTGPLSAFKPVVPDLYSQYLAYLFNIKQINWFVKYLTAPRTYAIDTAHDYTRQHEEHYSMGALKLKKRHPLPATIPPEKAKALSMLDTYCHTRHLQCLYLHGPMYRDVLKQSSDALRNINALLRSTLHHVRFVPAFYAADPSELGDKIDHIDPKWKEKSTEKIFEAIRPYLIEAIEGPT